VTLYISGVTLYEARMTSMTPKLAPYDSRVTLNNFRVIKDFKTYDRSKKFNVIL
jgi:hypothetical protein